MMLLLALAVIGGFAVYVMSAAERQRLLAHLLFVVALVKRVLVPKQSGQDPFRQALCARTPWPVVTLAIVAVQVLVFLLMLIRPGGGTAEESLLAWGASFGPRTTNGEWWRLAASLFVQPGFLAFVITLIGFVQIALIVERLVGHFAFATVYVAAGLLGGVVDLARQPIEIHAGASAAVFGVYGMFAAAVAQGLAQRSEVSIPLKALRHLVPGAAVFLVYYTLVNDIGAANTTGLGIGVIYGIVLTLQLARGKPSIRKVAAASAATAIVVLASTVVLRGVTDVRPELERLIATEERTATIYEKAVNQFRIGAMSAKALAQIIDRSIVPELRAARARLEAITGVPAQHQPIVSSAEEYLRLRDESWRIRSEALHSASMGALRTADRTERASLEALEKVRTASLN
jgi:membrane associated rhomboid family serine protease